MTAPCFLINPADVSYNSFDDEIIVIHLQSGMYFSLRGSAAAIWRVLQNGPSSAPAVSAAFEQVSVAEVAKVNEFLEELASHRLIVPAPADCAPLAANAVVKTPFSVPVLEAFDDLQGLLLADIVHDTDENGWPHLADRGHGDDAARAA